MIFYVVGIIYTFLGIAIVCDEFFVPALERMVEEFDVDDDVAGATVSDSKGGGGGDERQREGREKYSQKERKKERRKSTPGRPILILQTPS